MPAFYHCVAGKINSGSAIVLARASNPLNERRDIVLPEITCMLREFADQIGDSGVAVHNRTSNSFTEGHRPPMHP